MAGSGPIRQCTDDLAAQDQSYEVPTTRSRPGSILLDDPSHLKLSSCVPFTKEVEEGATDNVEPKPQSAKQDRSTDHVEPEPPSAKQEIKDACRKDPSSKKFALIVIGEELPPDLKEKHTNVKWAKIDTKEAVRILDEAFACMGYARLILENRTLETLQSVIQELPNCLDSKKYHRVSTFFMGHGAKGRFYLQNGASVNIADEVIAKLNALPSSMQQFHHFDFCRVGEDFAFLSKCLKGDAAVIYATQAGQISFTGENRIREMIGKGISDGVGVFTREFVILAKDHAYEGDFEQFVCKLNDRITKKLHQLDSTLNTDYCRVILLSTNTMQINFRKERAAALQPECKVRLSRNGYLAKFTVDQPPSCVNHDKYVVKTYRPQMKVTDSNDWEYLRGRFDATPGKKRTFQVPIPPEMLGCKVNFRVEATTGDGLKVYSEHDELNPPEFAKPVLSRMKKKHRCNKRVIISWNHTKPTADDVQGDVYPPQFERYFVQVKKQHENEEEEELHEIWKEPNEIDIDQQNCRASFKLEPGCHLVCVSAHFEGGGSTPSKTTEIIAKDIICTRRCICCCVSVLTTLAILVLVALGLILPAVLDVPKEPFQYQYYQGDIVVLANNLSLWNRIKYSRWKMWECPIPNKINSENSEHAYGDITASVLPSGGGSKYQETETVPINDTYTPGCYPLPYPIYKGNPSNAINRFMLEQSTATFDMCATPEQSSLEPFTIALFNNKSKFAKSVRSNNISNAIQMFNFSLDRHGRECKHYFYTVQRATYLYFGFCTPVNISLNMTTELVKWQYNSSVVTQNQYSIPTKKQQPVRVPIPLSSPQEIVIHSPRTDNGDQDRTHVCFIPELRFLMLKVVVPIFCLIVLIVLFACCCFLKIFCR